MRLWHSLRAAAHVAACCLIWLSAEQAAAHEMAHGLSQFHHSEALMRALPEDIKTPADVERFLRDPSVHGLAQGLEEAMAQRHVAAFCGHQRARPTCA